MAFSTVTFDDDAYEISPSVLNEFDLWQADFAATPPDSTPATYLLASVVQCPHCRAAIRSVHVHGLTGTRPAAGPSGQERGLVVACPKCASTVPSELAGL